jgi:hypothetical protein
MGTCDKIPARFCLFPDSHIALQLTNVLCIISTKACHHTQVLSNIATYKALACHCGSLGALRMRSTATLVTPYFYINAAPAI